MANTKVEHEINGVNATTTYEFQFPKKKEPLTFAQIIYNNKTGECLGRTPKSWFQILVFYVIFYAVLAALFAICMQGLFSTMNDRKPNYVLSGSLIGTNPGLGVRPIHEDPDKGAIIQFDPKKPENLVYWPERIDHFLEKYSDSNKTGNQKICDFHTVLKDNEVCAVKPGDFGDCVKEKNNYGYANAQPCVFLKLNKIYDWVPDFYSNVSDLPEEMPEDLKTHIRGIKDEKERQQVWVSCKAKHSHDKEHIGPIKYFPGRGFQSYYYPYTNIGGYLSPLVAVQFLRPKSGELIAVECRAWAKNIEYSGALKERKGSVQFELLID